VPPTRTREKLVGGRLGATTLPGWLTDPDKGAKVDTKSYEFLQFTRHDNGVLMVKMHRPEKKNAMNPALHSEMAPGVVRHR
jgi:hypothetical protein